MANKVQHDRLPRRRHLYVICLFQCDVRLSANNTTQQRCCVCEFNKSLLLDKVSMDSMMSNVYQQYYHRREEEAVTVGRVSTYFKT